MVKALRPSLMRNLPLYGAAASGAVVALAFIVLPTGWLENATESSGVAALLPVAAPPLGLTARAVLALGGGLAVAAVTWAALYLLFGPGGPLAVRTKRGDAPVVRRADAHPDAPPRWPLSAAELPSPTSPVEQDLPKDLDAPLAAFDPGAVLPVPREPVRPVKPLVPPPAPLPSVLAPGERLETFALTPPPPPAAPPREPEERPSIEALLRRLEQGAQRRVVAR